MGRAVASAVSIRAWKEPSVQAAKAWKLIGGCGAPGRSGAPAPPGKCCSRSRPPGLQNRQGKRGQRSDREPGGCASRRSQGNRRLRADRRSPRSPRKSRQVPWRLPPAAVAGALATGGGSRCARAGQVRRAGGDGTRRRWRGEGRRGDIAFKLVDRSVQRETPPKKRALPAASRAASGSSAAMRQYSQARLASAVPQSSRARRQKKSSLHNRRSSGGLFVN